MAQPQLSVTAFLDAVERSGLVDKSRLTQTLADLEREGGEGAITDSRVVSSHLTRVGLLTSWQTELLLAGRAKGFFVGKYKLLDHLGTGGMSSVYLAEHIVMRRRVAVKVLPSNRVNDSSYLARFHREARAAALLDHPNIVRAFDVDNEGNTHYLVMEYVDGRDLKAMVEDQGPLTYVTAAEYIRQAAEGLAHAHQAGLVHRDMKPANLLIDSKGTVKVLDLGLARFSDEVEASLTKEHDEKMLGTVDYLAPEQALDSHSADYRADIYSLGCTLYYALTGQPPFPTGTLAHRVVYHQTQEPPSIYLKRHDAPRELVEICRRMMAKSPDARYQSAAEVSKALTQFLKFYLERLSRAPEDEVDLELAPLEDEPARQPPTVKEPRKSVSQPSDKALPRPKPDSQSKAQLRPKETPRDRPASQTRASRAPDSDTIRQSAAASDSNTAPASKAASDSKKMPPGAAASDSKKTAPGGPASDSKKEQNQAASESRKSGRGAAARPPDERPATTNHDELLPPPVATPLDDLLAELSSAPAPAAMPSNSLTSGPYKTFSPTFSRRSSRWDSPWFLMGVGALLALIIIVAVWVAITFIPSW